ncbi:MAG: ABC transporter ATP-binding protein [Candidatus Anammoximicrobium sp.]|nr:ABC transporter ATP-binding protein [Candidatus Anammoximicrobium sp.]
MSDTLVFLDELHFAYPPRRPVLAGCSLRLRPAERVGLIGSNGSGKTTLLKAIVGLLHPTAGRVEIFGKPRTQERDFQEVRGRVGLLFQDSDDQLFCPSVAEDVAFGPLNQGKTRQEAGQIVALTLDELGLAGFEDRITYQLSGGEKRLVALAAVLAMQPEVLLLDEPTSGLDEEATERVVNVLASLPQAMLIVSHDRSMLQRIAANCYRLSAGRLQQLEMEPPRAEPTEAEPKSCKQHRPGQPGS